MRQIKAFVRTTVVERTVRALEEAGAPGITVSRCHGVGYGYEPESFTLAPRDLGLAPEVTKLEVVCRVEDEQRLVAAIVAAAHTGSPGDGIVFVAPVERAVKIRTAENGLGS